ncbi:NAD(P)H-dependent flavin oxidoreductase [Clostridiisalibacter paucivorans]|uniref:NAD(P)H-dependent flavin oxidoreductase n=1 Tax=Clostridiisalibacter paucivorans TaxID=408753 RepID=UPI00047AC412|nr:nitronate monooxygenase [Clostridiisalibacter paucivorans]
MKIPSLKIGDLTASVPIVQGGMGVGISMSRLAAAVANCGGIGVISGVEPGFNFDGYYKDKIKTNLKALRHHIRKAKELAPKNIIGVNIMTAINNFEDMVKTAVEEKIDIIFSGAGLPLSLPKFVKDSNTKIAPIVSSGRVAKLICKQWDKKYQYLPDAIVLEGPKAGGHLGFSNEDLETENENKSSLTDMVKEVLESIKPFERKYNRKIPVIAAGGVHDGRDIARLLLAGASGVQMGTRFVATHECDASEAFKKAYIDAKKDDVVIIKSPVGMPGRAINNDFIRKVYENYENKEIKCIRCLKGCNPKSTPYCIADALINAQKGNFEKGFAFAGENVYRIKEITSVKALIEGLMKEIEEYEA